MGRRSIGRRAHGNADELRAVREVYRRLSIREGYSVTDKEVIQDGAGGHARGDL